jgi:hypothetical protein
MVNVRGYYRWRFERWEFVQAHRRALPRRKA